MMVSVRVVETIFTYKNTRRLSCLVSFTLGDGESCDNTFTVNPDFVMVSFYGPSSQPPAVTVLTSRC